MSFVGHSLPLDLQPASQAADRQQQSKPFESSSFLHLLAARLDFLRVWVEIAGQHFTLASIHR